MMPEPTFADAYPASLRQLIEFGKAVPPVLDPLSPSSRFGEARRTTREIAPHVLQFRDPRACLFFNTQRVVHLAYCYGLLLWSLAGSNDVRRLQFYHPAAQAFADSPQQLSGAFGHRLLATHGDQLRSAANRLGEDPASRRTVCVIAWPEDNFRQTKEYPCALATQYLIRGGELSAFTYMRSQSAVMVLPYDVFLFCGLQLYLAAMLGIPAGPYAHMCTSFHAHEDELALASAIIANPTEEVRVSAMTGGARLEQLRLSEREIWEACRRGDTEPLRSTLRDIQNPTTFEEEAQLVLCAYAAIHLRRRAEAIEAVRRLPAGLQRLAAADLMEGLQ